MLTIKLHTEADALALTLQGHAGAGKWGKDIVCAAASILTYTAAGAAAQLYREGKLQTRPRIRLMRGSAGIRLENGEVARNLLDVIATGYSLLAVRYPDNVRFIRE